MNGTLRIYRIWKGLFVTVRKFDEEFDGFPPMCMNQTFMKKLGY